MRRWGCKKLRLLNSGNPASCVFCSAVECNKSQLHKAANDMVSLLSRLKSSAEHKNSEILYYY